MRVFLPVGTHLPYQVTDMPRAGAPKGVPEQQ
jgi:hypothetical protein